MKTYFVWLGSNRAKKNGVDEKGALLDQAAKARLPVPQGTILLNEFYDSLLEKEILTQENGRFTCANPIELYESLFTAARLPKFDKPIIVQNATSAKGYQERVLDVDSNNPKDLADALCKVWTSALTLEDEVQRDVLLLEQQHVQTTGVAFSQEAFEDDLIQVSAAKDLSGSKPTGNEFIVSPQLRDGELSSEELSGVARRVQKLLRGVRRTFGNENWQIEWVDDGNICWLVQLLSLKQPPPRHDVYAFAPFQAVLSTFSSPLLTSLLVDENEQILNSLHNIDLQLPHNRQFVRAFEERPFINLSLLADIKRKCGLPTFSVTNPNSNKKGTAVNLKLGRLIVHLPTVLKLGGRRLTAVSLIKQTTDNLNQTDQSPANDLEALIQSFSSILAKLMGNFLIATLYQKPKPASQQWQSPLNLAVDLFKKQIEPLAEQYVAREQLPNTQAIWLLSINEVAQLASGQQFNAEAITERQHNFTSIDQERSQTDRVFLLTDAHQNPKDPVY
ncbi:MAG: hypothetical protein AAF490_05250 [Chloroflexota bacterium]